MRTLLALAMFAAPALAGSVSPYSMQVGDTGPLAVPGSGYTISEVGDDWLALRYKGFENKTMTILVRGIPTAGLVDDKAWTPDKLTVFKVEKTEKYKGKTVFVLVAQKK
jgi:hypothetical protein